MRCTLVLSTLVLVPLVVRAQSAPPTRASELSEARRVSSEARSVSSCVGRRTALDRAIERAAEGGSLRLVRDARERLEDCVHDATAVVASSANIESAPRRTRRIVQHAPLEVRTTEGRPVGGPLVSDLRRRVADVRRCRALTSEGAAGVVELGLRLDAEGRYSHLSLQSAGVPTYVRCLNEALSSWRAVGANALHAGDFRVRLDLDRLPATTAAPPAPPAPTAAPAPPPPPVASQAASGGSSSPTRRGGSLVVVDGAGREAFGPVLDDLRARTTELTACRAAHSANVPSQVELRLAVDDEGAYEGLAFRTLVGPAFVACVAAAVGGWRVQGANHLHAGTYRVRLAF